MTIFFALYRLALRLGPRGLQERHADEQLELIRRMAHEEAPPGLLRSTAWKIARLARAVWASLAAHIDRRRRRRTSGPWLTGVGGDVRLALRSLRKSPWYAGSTVAVLGAGIALSAVVFAIVDGVLFKPLPYPAADRLFVVDAQITSRPSSKLTAVSSVETGIWTAAVAEVALTSVGAIAGPFNRKDGVDQLMRTVDEHFFDVVGIRPEFGSFQPEDFEWRDRVVRPGPAPREMYWPVVISHALWRREYGMDPSVIGQRITRSERGGEKFGHIVRGVLPADFVFPLDLGGRQPDVLSPEGSSLARRQADTRRNYYVLARVGVNAPVPAIETRLREVTRRESRLHPSTDNAAHGAVAQPPFDTLTLVPVGEHLGASARPALRLIAGGAALLLLIICLNVTGLAAARGVDRAVDFATRRALGASSWHLARLVGIEVLALVIAGVVLGLWLAEPLLRITLKLLPQSLVLLKAPAIDVRVISVMAVATLACAALIAALPALRASHFDIAPAITGRTGRSNRAVRRRGLILIGAQAALGFILVTAGALTMTSLALAWANDVGFAADRTVLLEAYLSSYANSQDSFTKLTHARSRLAQVPGTAGVAATNIHMFSEMFPPGWAPIGSLPFKSTADHQVEQTFFDVMGLHAIEGRLPDKGEWPPDGPFVVISEATARLWWPGETAVGRRIRSSRRVTNPERTVVAVVRDARYESLDREPLGSVYLPIDFEGRYGAVFVVRTAGDPDDVMPGLLAVARETGLNLERAVPLDEGFFIATVHRALPAWLFGSLGIVGLVVLAVGTFGLLAMAAAQRARELVIRVALGASSSNVIGLLVRDQLTAVVIGLGAGAAVSYWTVALLESQLYRVSPFSPAVWLASAAALMCVATIATLIPSIRRSRVNPAEALRAE
jgi:predicted permease